MSTVKVYKNKDEVFYNTIHQEFQIWKDTAGRLCWDATENVNGPGVIKVWLQVVGSTPGIPFVLPDWQLIIDGLWMEKRFYYDDEKNYVFYDMSGTALPGFAGSMFKF